MGQLPQAWGWFKKQDLSGEHKLKAPGADDSHEESEKGSRSLQRGGRWSVKRALLAKRTAWAEARQQTECQALQVDERGGARAREGPGSQANQVRFILRAGGSVQRVLSKKRTW